jgi:hypothetical protein
MRTLIILVLAIGLTVLIGNALVDADPPPVMVYQGRLTDNKGAPLTGQHQITFSLYKYPAGGGYNWTETHTVDVVDGLFWVPLGSQTPLDHSYFVGAPRFLGISVDGDPEISPRTYIGSVGFAYRIGTIDGADGGDITGDISLSGSLEVQGTTTVGDAINTPSGVTIQSTGDTLKVVSGATAIVIRPDGVIVLESDSVSIVSHGGMDISADDDLTFSGRNVNINADFDVTIDAGYDVDMDAGMGMTLDAPINMTINSGSTATLSGSTVRVTGGVTDIDGGLVTIN